ncbi:unnamed protein product [Victoria cruziana]
MASGGESGGGTTLMDLITADPSAMAQSSSAPPPSTTLGKPSHPPPQQQQTATGTEKKSKKSTFMQIQSDTISVAKALNPVRANIIPQKQKKKPVSYSQLARSIHELAATSDQKNSQRQLVHHVFPKLAVYNSVDPSLAPSLIMLHQQCEDRNVLRYVYYYLARILSDSGAQGLSPGGGIPTPNWDALADIDAVGGVTRADVVPRIVERLTSEALNADTEGVADSGNQKRKKGMFGRQGADKEHVIRSNLQYAALSALRRLPLDPGNPAFLHRSIQGVSFVDPVAVRHALGIISDLAMIDPYSVAVALEKLLGAGGALQEVLHLHDVLARVCLAKLCYTLSRAHALDERPDLKSQFTAVLYQLLLDPSERVCFEAIYCVLGKFDNAERTEERAAGWIRLTREILKLPEAPSLASGKGDSQAKENSAQTKDDIPSKMDRAASKSRHPQPLIKLVKRRRRGETVASLLASLLEIVRTTVACECVYVRAMVIKALIWMQSPDESVEELEAIIASELSDPVWPSALLNDILLTLHARFKASPDMAVTLLEIARIFATKVPGKIDSDVLQLLWKTCLVGAGPSGKHTALEAVTIVLDLPPPQPGSMAGITSVDKVSASDPKSALALQRLVQAAVWFLGENANYAASEYAWESATPPGTALMMLDADKMVAAAGSRNPTLAGALTRLQRCSFIGSWEVRIVAVQALTTMAIRSGEPFRLQIYEFLHALVQGGVQAQFSDMQLSNGEDQGASGTGLGSLISPMLKVLDEMYEAQDNLISAKLIDIYRNRHHIDASTGLNDPAVATGISDLIYESKVKQPKEESGDADFVNIWATNMEDGEWGSSAPAINRVNEFLTGAGTDAPEVDEEIAISRPSVSYDDMWAKTLLETSEAEEDDARSSGASSPESTGSIESSISSHFGGMRYPSLFSSHPSSYNKSDDHHGPTTMSRLSNTSYGAPSSSMDGLGSPAREEPPSYGSSIMQTYGSFENPIRGNENQSFSEQDGTAENPQFGKALYDFTAGGDDELNLTTGEEVEIDYEVDGWYYVKKRRPGRDGKMAGLVPVLYVSSS